MTTKRQGGRLSLPKQAELDHERLETRIDLAMAKATPKLVKHFLWMVDNIATQKDTIQMKLIEKGMGHNKDFMKAFKEAVAAAQDNNVEEEEDESPMMIDLTSSETASSKTLN